MVKLLSSLLAVAVAVSAASSKTTAAEATPTVTLDYSTIVPVYGNSSLGYYKFQNVRFAAPPTGSLRFAAPAWPAKENTTNVGNYADPNVACNTAEDCLFCDIYAPAAAFTSNKKFPVAQWYWGGGYAFGSKTTNTPEGLYNVSKGFVWISCNHRLGVFGLVNGPTFANEGGATNAAAGSYTHLTLPTKRIV